MINTDIYIKQLTKLVNTVEKNWLGLENQNCDLPHYWHNTFWPLTTNSWSLVVIFCQSDNWICIAMNWFLNFLYISIFFSIIMMMKHLQGEKYVIVNKYLFLPTSIQLLKRNRTNLYMKTLTCINKNVVTYKTYII